MTNNTNNDTGKTTNNNDDEEFGRKFDERVTPFDKPWLEPTTIQQVDPTNDKQWHDREDKLNGIAYSYINNILKPKGSALPSEIRNDLQAYFNMTDKGNVESTLLRISADPKTEAAIEPNTNKIHFVRYNRELEQQEG